MNRFAFLALGAALAVAGWSTSAGAYPQYVAKGYTSCSTCHYSPTGGGLPNSYGHMATAATFPDELPFAGIEKLRDSLSKRDVTGRDESGGRALHYDAGLDSRLMFTTTQTERGDDSKDWIFIPMLVEAGVVAAYGDGLAYATITPRPAGGSSSGRYDAVSREHWIQYKISDGQGLRFGRMTLPFGLRIADHNAPTRQAFGFGSFDQRYALAWDWLTDDVSVSVAAFGGSRLDVLEERGAAASVTYMFPSRLAIGASLLGSDAVATARVAGSLFARWRIWSSTYALAELAGQQRSTKGADASMVEAATLLRAGWFPMESLDLFAQVGGRRIQKAYEATKLRYMVGTDWKVLPWVELSPAYVFDENVEAGPSHQLLGQMHVFW